MSSEVENWSWAVQVPLVILAIQAPCLQSSSKFESIFSANFVFGIILILPVRMSVVYY